MRSQALATPSLSEAEAIWGPEDEMQIPTMQVMLRPGGQWHRRGPIPVETACGIPLPQGGFRVRDYELEGPFCRDCHSPRECHLAAGPDASSNGGSNGY